MHCEIPIEISNVSRVHFDSLNNTKRQSQLFYLHGISCYLIAKSVWQTLQLVTTVNFVVDAGLTKRQRESSVSDVSSFVDSKRV